MPFAALWGGLDAVHSDVNCFLLDQANFMPTPSMITPLTITDHEQNPYIEARIYHIVPGDGMIFGEFLAPSGKLEEVIINPLQDQPDVRGFLKTGMTVHVRQPRRNTAPHAQTQWRCFLRPAEEQPIYLQHAYYQSKIKPADKQPVEQSVEQRQIEFQQKDSVKKDLRNLRVSITDYHNDKYIRDWAKDAGYTGNNALTKAVNEIIRAAMQAGLKFNG